MRALLVLALLPVLLAGMAIAQNTTGNSTAPPAAGTNATAPASAGTNATAPGNATAPANATAAGNATAPAGPPTASVTMHAHADGDTYYWTQGTDTAHNPTLSFAAGTQVTVTIVDDSDQTHNFAVAPDTKGSPYVSAKGDQETYTFTMPSTDTQYYCVPHKSLGMGGTIKVATTGGSAGGSASPPAAAPTPAPTSFTIVAHADGDTYYWTLDGQTEHNPTITVAPDTTITVTVKDSGTVTHNFAVTPDTKGSAYVNSPGDTATYTFKSGPEGTSATYFCVPHGSLGMKGTLKFAKLIAPPAPAGGGGATTGVLGTGAINGQTADLGQLTGDAKCNGMAVPAPSADKLVGGPTLADYKQRCDVGGAPQTAVLPSPADNVIPISLGLIAIGVVGVVWVHKFYSP